MSDLLQVADFVIDCVTGYFSTLSASWLGRCFIYLIVLGFAVSIICVFRGSKGGNK